MVDSTWRTGGRTGVMLMLLCILSVEVHAGARTVAGAAETGMEWRREQVARAVRGGLDKFKRYSEHMSKYGEEGQHIIGDVAMDAGVDPAELLPGADDITVSLTTAQAKKILSRGQTSLDPSVDWYNPFVEAKRRWDEKEGNPVDSTPDEDARLNWYDMFRGPRAKKESVDGEGPVSDTGGEPSSISVDSPDEQSAPKNGGASPPSSWRHSDSGKSMNHIASMLGWDTPFLSEDDDDDADSGGVPSQLSEAEYNSDDTVSEPPQSLSPEPSVVSESDNDEPDEPDIASDPLVDRYGLEPW